MSPNFKNILVEPIETFRFEDEENLVVRAREPASFWRENVIAVVVLL